MELTEALDIAIRETGHAYLRVLAARDPAYTGLVFRIAAEGWPLPGPVGSPVPIPTPALSPDPSPLPPAESIRLVRAMRACPHFRARSDCGCGTNGCAFPWRTRLVAHRDCATCLARTVE